MNNNLEKEKDEEKLELVFGTEKLLESAKEPFVGEVIYAEYPCHCEDCEKGASALQEQYGKVAPDRLHIKMKPLSVYTEVQHQWWNPTKTKLSKWGALQAQLEALGLMDKFKTDGVKAFLGLVAEWTWADVAVGVTGEEKFHWLPSKILTGEEIDELVSQQSDEPSKPNSANDIPPSDPGTGEGEPDEPSTGEGEPSEPNTGENKA